MRILPAVLMVLAIPLSGCFGAFGGGARDVGPGDYIRDADYKSWHIEVDYANGVRPADALLDFVKGHLAAVVRKPAGITIATDDALAGDASKAWRDSEIWEYAEDHRTYKTGGEKVVTHLLFLAGHYAADTGDRKVLAVTYRYDLIVVFPQTIEGSCTIVNLCTDARPMMRAVALHEFGHALGLVNRGTPMVHAHEAQTCNGEPDEGHSANTQSVMYCAVETSDIVALLRSGGIPQDFDANDRADLHAAGGA